MIIDTDVGFDDLLGILYLLAEGSTRIEAFTVVSGIAHVKEGANALLRMQELLGLAAPIPVYPGLSDQPESFPNAWRNQASSLGWGDPIKLRPQPVPAVDFLRSRFAQSQPVRLLTIGPLTNLGAALGPAAPTAPIAATSMGGAIRVPGNLPVRNPVAEANMYVDPPAARTFFNFFGLDAPPACSETLAPLDASNMVPIDRAFVAAFRAASGGKLLELATQILVEIDTQFLEKNVPYFAYDPLAAVSTVDPSVLQLQPGAVAVGDLGQTTLVPGSAGPQTVALGANAATFYADFKRAFGVSAASAAG